MIPGKIVPKKFFLTSGVGYHRDKLISFEYALRDAGIGAFNLVPVSSIIPPGAKLVSKEEGLKELEPGQIVFCAMARNSTCEKGRVVCSSVGIAYTDNPKIHGYLSEFYDFGLSEREAGAYAQRMAVEMLLTLLGIDPSGFDFEKFAEGVKIGDMIIKAGYTSASASCRKNGEWVTVVSAAVFVC